MDKKTLVAQRKKTLDRLKDNPNGLVNAAKAKEQTLTQYVNSNIPADENGQSGMDWLLEYEGIRLHENDRGYASTLGEIGLTEELETHKTGKAILYYETLDKMFYDAVAGEIPIFPDKAIEVNRDALVSALTPNSPLRPFDTKPFMRAKLFQPEADYRRVTGMIETTTEKDVRLPKWDNVVAEREMGTTPEGTPPKLVEMGFDEKQGELSSVGTGIRVSYDWLRNSRNRVNAVANLVAEIGIAWRQFLWLECIRTIHAAWVARGASKISVGSGGTPDADQFEEKVNEAMIPYNADSIVCRVGLKNKYKRMIVGGDGQSGNTNAVIGLLLMGSVGQMMDLNDRSSFARIGSTKYLNSILGANEWTVFDQARSTILFLMRNAQQDEIARDPENRHLTRYFNTSYLYHCPDSNGIEIATFA